MKDYYQVLKIDRSATTEEIREAYLKLAKEHHPDKHAGEGDSAGANQEFTVIAEAYKVLIDRKRRREYDQALLAPQRDASPEEKASRVQAEASFKHGMSALEAKEFARAEMYLRAACDLNPEVAKYRSFLGVAMAGQGKGFKAAESRCKEAIEMEIYNPNHYVNLGIVYRMMGQAEKAKSQFEQALQWNPKHKTALGELEKLKTGRKGILERFLKKRG